MSDPRNPHASIEALLTPRDSVLLLIDHQAFQFANLHSDQPQLLVPNVVGLAKTATLADQRSVHHEASQQRLESVRAGLGESFNESMRGSCA